jgi:hypothetical protein
VYVDDDLPAGGGSKAPRVDTGIDEAPLPSPVVAHGVVAVHDTTVHPVRPLDVGVHRRQRALDVQR